MNGAVFKGRNRIFNKARFIQGVGVNGDLSIGFFRHGQTAINGRRRGTPVFVQFEADGAGGNLLMQGIRQAGVAFTQKPKIHRKAVGGFEHARHVPGAGSYCGGVGPGGRSGTTTQHGGHTRSQGLFNLLWADKVNVRIDTACGDDMALTGNHIRTRANYDIHPRLHIRVTGFTNRGYTPMFDADVGFNNAPVIYDQSIGNHQINHLR